MAAGGFTLFAEMACQSVALTAVHGDQLHDLLKTIDLRLFPFDDALVEFIDQSVDGLRLPHKLKPQTYAGNLDLQQLLLPQPIERLYDPVTGGNTVI